MLVRALAVDMASARSQEFPIAPAMIFVIVRTQYVLHRLICDAFDVRHNRVMILVELVIHQNHSFAGQIDRHIAAIAFNIIEVGGGVSPHSANARFANQYTARQPIPAETASLSRQQEEIRSRTSGKIKSTIAI